MCQNENKKMNIAFQLHIPMINQYMEMLFRFKRTTRDLE